MATTTDIIGSQRSEGPPAIEVGVLGWIRENLFSSVFNTILTLIGVFIVYSLVRSTIVNFIPESDWTVVISNWKLLLIGQYPREESLRPIISLGVVAGLAIAQLLFWRRALIARRVLTVLWLLSPIIIWILLAGFPGFVFPVHEFFFVPITPPVRWIVAGVLGVAIRAYLTNQRPDEQLQTRTLVLWFLVPFLGLIVLNRILAIVLSDTLFPVTYNITIPALFPNSLTIVRTQLWSGLLLTIMLAVVGIVASFPLGVLLALGRRSDMVILKWLSIAFIEVVRGVPLISILFMAQVMLPLFINNRDMDVVLRAMGGFTIFSAAYVAETVRGGLQAIPGGQVEAAEALGLNPVQVTGLIVLPQAIRIVIPSMVGQFISLFKDTTLVSIITLLDLLGISRAAVAQNPAFVFHQREVFIFLAAIYFVLSYLMSSGARRIEASTSAMGGTRKL